MFDKVNCRYGFSKADFYRLDFGQSISKTDDNYVTKTDVRDLTERYKTNVFSC